MSRRSIYLTVGIVLLLHVGLFFVLAHLRALPKSRAIPRPNFITLEQAYTDAETGKKFTYREFRVNTKLADPEFLRRVAAARAAASSPPPTSTPVP